MVDIYEIRNLINKLDYIQESLSYSEFQYNECNNDDHESELSKDEYEFQKLKAKIHKKMKKYLSKN